MLLPTCKLPSDGSHSWRTALLAGVKGYKVLKTTQSGYVGYLKDKFTLLPETTDRIAATSITATWRHVLLGTLTVPFHEGVS